MSSCCIIYAFTKFFIKQGEELSGRLSVVVITNVNKVHAVFVQSHLFMKKAKYKRVPSGIKTYEHSVAKKLSKLMCTPTEYFLVVSRN